MRIICTAPGAFEGDALEAGHSYDVVDVSDPTERQNRAFHALLQEFFVLGAHSYPAKSLDDLKKFVKKDLGAGFERFIYPVWENGRMMLKAYLPGQKPEIPMGDNHAPCKPFGILKSWSDYTKRERKDTIDRLVPQIAAYLWGRIKAFTDTPAVRQQPFA